MGAAAWPALPITLILSIVLALKLETSFCHPSEGSSYQEASKMTFQGMYARPSHSSDSAYNYQSNLECGHAFLIDVIVVQGMVFAAVLLLTVISGISVRLADSYACC